MDYEFDVTISETIIIDGETVVTVTDVIGNKVRIGIVGPHEVWREEIPYKKEQ